VVKRSSSDTGDFTVPFAFVQVPMISSENLAENKTRGMSSFVPKRKRTFPWRISIVHFPQSLFLSFAKLSYRFSGKIKQQTTTPKKCIATHSLFVVRKKRSAEKR